jgi:ribonuclease-3 family protein
MAYIGDAVFELLTRKAVLSSGKTTAKHLHRAVVTLVNASAQAAMSARLETLLTDAERAVWRRGRNTKLHHVPQNASVMEYHLATALECVFGWLELRNEQGRIQELFASITAASEDSEI